MTISGPIKNFNIITIGLDITTLCNYSCEYCYSRPSYEVEWNKDNLNLENVSKLINVCLRTKNKFIFNILGGEPTLSKNFITIIELLQSYNFEINIFTNFSKKEDFWKCIDLSRINSLVIPIHLNQIKDIDYFFNKIDIISQHVKISLRLMLIDNDYWFQFINKYFDKLRSLNQNISIEIDPISITIDKYKSLILKYKDLYNIFSRKIIINDDFIDEKDLFKYISTTKGLECYQNNYLYKIDNYIYDTCSNKRYTIAEAYFKFKQNNIIKCEHNFCPCHHFLDSYKIKKD